MSIINHCHRCGKDFPAAPGPLEAPSHRVFGYRYCEPCALHVADKVDPALARIIRQARARRVRMAVHIAAVDRERDNVPA